MQRVVLFKSESDEYRTAFEEHKFATVFVEPLQFEPVNGEALAARLLRAEYRGLVVSSARAVDAMARCWDPARRALWGARRVYAVGGATARRVESSLALEARGESSGNAQNLAKLISEENPKFSEFLFPCGNLRSETLPAILEEAEISVDALTVYETKENVNLKKDLMELDAGPEPRCLVFFSPSGCEYIHRQLQTFSNQLSRLPRFAIGNSTAHKIENLGLEIAGVAASPSAACLVHAVSKYFASVEGGGS